MITLYTLYILSNSLTIHEKTITTFYSTLFLNTKKPIENQAENQNKNQINKNNHQKKYEIKGFKFSRQQILKIIELHIVKKLTVANASYDIVPVVKYKDKSYMLIKFNLSLKCSFFQLIQLFEVLNKFAITISDFSITPHSQGKSDIEISFTAPAYQN